VGIGSLLANRPSGAEQLIAIADGALYRAKQQGRDRVANAAVPAATPERAAPAPLPAS
jgi:PleD family two-component response regulator